MQISNPILPMRTEDMQAPFDDNCYMFERAWHGQRTLLFLLDQYWYLQDERGQPLHAPRLDLPFERLPKGHICDGILEQDPYTKSRYVVFDILYFHHKNVMQEPLINRKAILDDLFLGLNTTALTTNPWIWREGKTAARDFAATGARAMIAKHIYSDYVAGNSSASWLKIPLAHLQLPASEHKLIA